MYKRTCQNLELNLDALIMLRNGLTRKGIIVWDTLWGMFNFFAHFHTCWISFMLAWVVWHGISYTLRKSVSSGNRGRLTVIICMSQLSLWWKIYLFGHSMDLYCSRLLMICNKLTNYENKLANRVEYILLFKAWHSVALCWKNRKNIHYLQIY